MARKKRVWYPGATYHVMSRGNRRTEIFKEHSDYIFFLELIEDLRKKYPFTIHSICLMTNHYHMLMETEDTELWKIMQKLLSVYAEEYNHKHNYSGHLFQGRYTACLIENEQYFLEVSRYIHLNPVKAQMVRKPSAYLYDSYRLFMGQAGNDVDEKNKTELLLSDIVDTTRVLSYFNNNPNEQYRMFVETKISHEEQEMLIQKDMKEDDMWLPR